MKRMGRFGLGLVLVVLAGGIVDASVVDYTGEIVVKTETTYKAHSSTSTGASDDVQAWTSCRVTYVLAGSRSRVSAIYKSHYERRSTRGSNWEREVENFNGTIDAAYNPRVQVTASQGIGGSYEITYKPFMSEMQGTDTIDRPRMPLETHHIKTGVYCHDAATVTGSKRSGQNSEVYEDQVPEDGFFGRRHEESGTKVVQWRIAGPTRIP